MDKLQRAKIILLKKSSLLGTLSLTLPVKTDGERTKTACIDKKGNIFFNPEFLNTITTEEAAEVLAHEILHLILNHFANTKNKNKNIWNFATDIAINSYLKETLNFKLEKGLHPEDFGFSPLKSAEHYYDMLKNKDLPELEKSYYDEHPDEVEVDDEIKEKVASAVSASRASGENLPSEIRKVIDEFLNGKGKVNWKQILSQEVKATINLEDYTYRKPDRTYILQNIIVPSLEGKKLKIAVAVDISGSVHDIVQEFLVEVNKILTSFRKYEVLLLYCDDKIRDITVIKSPRKFPDKIEVKGFGGTDFRPVFEFLAKKKDYKLLVYLTDGYGTYPNRRPAGLKTIWVLFNSDATPPFGKIIKVNK